MTMMSVEVVEEEHEEVEPSNTTTDLASPTKQTIVVMNLRILEPVGVALTMKDPSNLKDVENEEGIAFKIRTTIILLNNPFRIGILIVMILVHREVEVRVENLKEIPRVKAQLF